MDLSRPLAVVTPTVDGDVLTVLAGAAASFTGRQVHQMAGRHSERGVRNALQRLAKQGIVDRTRIGSSDLYTLNREHLASPYIRALAGLKAELLLRVREELASWSVPAAYAAIFGSAARGEMRVDSDIDVFVVRPSAVSEADITWQDQVANLAERITAWTGNDARVLELSVEEVDDGVARDEQVLIDIREQGLGVAGPRNYLRKGAVANG